MGCINIWNCHNYFSTLGPPPIGDKPLCKLPENMPIPNPKDGIASKRNAKTEAARTRPRMSHVEKAPAQRSEDEDDEPPIDEEKDEGAPPLVLQSQRLRIHHSPNLGRSMGRRMILRVGVTNRHRNLTREKYFTIFCA